MMAADAGAHGCVQMLPDQQHPLEQHTADHNHEHVLFPTTDQQQTQGQQQQQVDQQHTSAEQCSLSPGSVAAAAQKPPQLQVSHELSQPADQVQVQVLQAPLGSPSPFCSRSFITADTTYEPASKKARTTPLHTPAAQDQSMGAAGDQDALVEAKASSSRAAQPTVDSTTAQDRLSRPADGSLPAELSSWGMLRCGSINLASSLATPRFARLSGLISLNLEPQPPTASAAQGSTGGGSGGMVGSSYGPAQQSGAKRLFADVGPPDKCTELCEAAQAAAMRNPDHGGTPSLAALLEWEHTIEAAEQQWGSSHPAVGRAWLELAQALQVADKDSDRAKHATKKAFDICQILLKQTSSDSHAQESFQYLLDKFNSKATAVKETRGAEAARNAAAAATAAASEACYKEVVTPAAAAAATVPLSVPLPAPTGSAATPVKGARDGNSMTAAEAAAVAAAAAHAAAMPHASLANGMLMVSEQLQLQLPYLQAPFVLCPPLSQVVRSAFLPAALRASMPALQTALSCDPAAATTKAGAVAAALALPGQLLAADLHSGALAGCAGLPTAALLAAAAAAAVNGEGVSKLQSPLRLAQATAAAAGSTNAAPAAAVLSMAPEPAPSPAAKAAVGSVLQ